MALDSVNNYFLLLFLAVLLITPHDSPSDHATLLLYDATMV